MTARIALIAAFLIFVGGIGPLLTPHRPETQFAAGLDREGMPVGPSPRFLLGCDSLGRDVLSRVLVGSRLSLGIALAATAVAAVVGLLIGLPSGYLGGRADQCLMRLTEVVMTIPTLLLALTLAGLMDGRVVHLHPGSLPLHFLDFRLERGGASVVFVLAAVSWTGFARVVRGQTLLLREREFVQAARALGSGAGWVLRRHLLPNVLPALVTFAALNMAGTIGLEAGLSYLGVGVPPPAPSWGGMIAEGQAYLLVAPWIVLPPGLAVVLTVTAFNLLGQGLHDPHRGSP